MKESFKFGVILLLFCAFSAGLLAYVNSFTAPVIAKAELEATLESYKVIFGDKADKFEEFSKDKLDAVKAKFPDVEKVFIATKGGNVVGYGINIKAKGFGGDMTNAIGILSADDKIAGFRNISNSETKGFGTQIQDEKYFSTYVDKSADGPLSINVDPNGEHEVLQISGATVTSKGVLAGDNKALEAYAKCIKGIK